MTIKTITRPVTSLGFVALTVGVLSACTSAPTYGTGTRADMQLMNDVSNLLTISPKQQAAIEYQARPDIVQPASTASLPAPQEKISDVDGNWPESPEERRQRLRDEATANQNDPFYRSPIVNTGLGQVQDKPLTPEEQRQRFREGRKIQQGAYQGRRYLSDPPAEYKVPVDTAPVGELGEPEKKKEARRLKAARKNTGWRWWPFS
jgi:hypothetical protein